MQFLSTLLVVLPALGSVLAQLPIIPLGPGPVIPGPGKIIRPKDGSRHLYGSTIPFTYNYTVAAKDLVAPPTVNVYVWKNGDEHFIEVGKDLDCNNSRCDGGILHHNITLSDFHPLIGTGNYELWTVQTNYAPYVIHDTHRITTITFTGLVRFIVDLPFGGPLDAKPVIGGLEGQGKHDVQNILVM